MKKKKKAICKKIIVSIITVIFTVALYVPFVPKMKALSNVTSSNNYGGYTWQIIDTAFDMDGNVTLSSAQISMNLNGHYNGSFIINISLSTIIDSSGIGYTNTINNYGFICNGCRITTYDSSHLYVAITDCNYWEIQIIPIKNASIKNWKSILNAFDIQSISGWSMTKLDEITATQISTIQTTLTNLNNNVITTNTRLNTTNTELHNIYNAISSGGTYGSIQSQLYNMGINLSSEIDQTIAIKNKLDSYLSGTIDNETVSIWDLVNDTNFSLDSINTTLNTINSHINDYTSQLNAIQTSLSNIETSLNNIDNTIDTITWRNFTTPSELSYSYDDITYTDYTSGNININGHVILKIPSQAQRYSHLYKLTLPFLYYCSASNGGYLLDDILISAKTIDTNVIYWTAAANEQLVIYFVSNSSVNSSNIYMTIKTKTNKGSLNSKGNFSLQYIPTTDIEYWQLLQYMDTYNMNRKILSALENLNMSVTNTTVQDTTTNITDYNNIYNQVSTVEQTYINEYNTNNTNLQSIINDKKGLPDNIVNVSTDIESKMGQLFTVPEFKYLFALIISGCVLLALLG